VVLNPGNRLGPNSGNCPPVTRRVTETGLGLVQVLPLAEARAKAHDLQRQIAQGICPIQARRVAKATLSGTMTFGQCAEEWLKTHEPGWRSATQPRNVRVLLFVHGKPLLNVPISTVTPDQVHHALVGLWTRHPSQAKRSLAMWERVLDYARARGARQGDNPASWKGLHQYRFPRNKQTGNHFPALPYSQVPELIRTLRTRNIISATALELLILTTARTGEIIAMRWSEIDWDSKVWTLTGMRTKQGRPHQVPLSNRAMAILQTRRDNGSDYVFQLSNKAMVWVLKTIHPDVTVHGFRSSFRNWAGDETSFARENIEECLGHQVGNAVERAYRRTTALEKRRVIMEAWAGYCHDNR
jgi:integrase